jgi:hypothetical protein
LSWLHFYKEIAMKFMTRFVALGVLLAGHLFAQTLGASPQAKPDVKAVVMASLAKVRTTVANMKDADPVNEASLRQMERDLDPLCAESDDAEKSFGGGPDYGADLVPTTRSAG